MASIITTKHLSHRYSVGTPFEKTALDDINLTIKEGSFVGIIGHTGSGKSTLIQHFNGLLAPSSGQIFIDGVDIWAAKQKASLRAIRFLVGLVFQYPEYQLFEESVGADIAYGPKNMDLSPETIAERVAEAMAFVDLPASIKDKSPFELSGGQKRRVAIAGVLAMRPRVLILDEPTAGLDPLGRDRLLQQIKRYGKQTGTTILFVSHSMEDIARYTDRVLVMNHGRVWGFDTPERIFSRSGELQQMGLAIPQIATLSEQLQAKGIPLSGSHYTVDALEQALLPLLSPSNLTRQEEEASC